MSIYDVSIHALLAECDMMRVRQRSDVFGFNPRTPCGVRPSPPPEKLKQSWFQSTHSLRSATLDKKLFRVDKEVSIHALLAECDPDVRIRTLTSKRFQSTHSLRSATRI